MRTIEEIENDRWPDPGPDATYLVRRCTDLRRTPLSDFTVEDLRILLGQQIAVPILAPRAVEIVAEDPLAEGDFYPGDLLYVLLRLPASAWVAVPDAHRRLSAALADLDLDGTDVPEDVVHALAEFRRRGPIEGRRPRGRAHARRSRA